MFISVESKSVLYVSIEKLNYDLKNRLSNFLILKPIEDIKHVFKNLSKNSDLYILGLNYKDKKNNSIKFLEELGNPFSKILIDPDGTISISLGAYGVPETFLVNNKSEIIKKYIGPLTYENISEIKKIIN